MTRTRPTAAARRALMLGTALAALAALPGTAYGQAFNGTPSTQGGSVTYDRAAPDGAGTERITVNSPQAVINWVLPTPPPGPFVFLPAGNTATFQGGAGNGNFAVLNRVVNAGGSVVVFNGTVVSQVSALNNATSGTVAFYTPNGLLIGATGAFNVGNLILTTLDPQFQPSGQFIGPAGEINFQLNPNLPASTVTTVAGAQINANQPNSYVIFAAPGITHGGSVRVNGSAAYVAMSSGTISHNAGLFDIQVDVGTAVATPLVHTGSTSGPASTGAADMQNIAMVAVSEGTAFEALIGGQIGYDAPLSAAIENGAIVISTSSRTDPADAAAATVTINGGNFTSDVTAESSHDAAVTGNVAFTQDLTLAGPRNVRLTAGAGQTISVGGNLLLTSESALANHPSDDRTGGDVRMSAGAGGTIQVSGNAEVRADGIGRIGRAGLRIGNGTGGTAEVSADGGAIRVDGALTVSADGLTEDVAPAVPPGGGIGQGGFARLGAANGGSVTVGGAMRTSATGTAATTAGGDPVTPSGTGGQATVEALGGGQVTVTGASVVAVTGRGGSLANGGLVAGTGQGGTAALSAQGGNVDLLGGLNVDARGVGGLGPGGGQGQGGNIDVTASGNGRIRAQAGIAALDASGIGAAGSGVTQNGGAGTGGNIIVRALPDAGAGTIQLGATNAVAQGVGGAGGPAVGPPSPLAAGAGGDAQGGTIAFTADHDGGVLAVGAFRADARAFGGAGGAPASAGDAPGAGGAATGGEISVGIRGNDGGVNALVGTASFASADLNASGIGGGGDAAGAGTGGDATLLVQGGAGLTVNGPLAVAASGFGGNGSVTSGNGTGGRAEINATAGTATLAGGSTLTAVGVGGNIDATGTTAGTGQGGTAQAVAAGAGTQVNITGGLGLDSSGSGGFSSSPTALAGQMGGAGTGGTASLQATGGATIGATGAGNLIADGFGGTAGAGGAGAGGVANISAAGANSVVTLGSANVQADGQGAVRGLAPTVITSGNSTGGQAAVQSGTGGAVRIGLPNAGSLAVSARGLHGVGNSGAAGATATGGTARIEAVGGTVQVGLDATVDSFAIARGGDGAGGSATGGTAAMLAGAGGSITIGRNANGQSTGVGGAGTTTGGEGRGGTARLRAAGGTISAGGTSVLGASGLGGTGPDGGAGTGGTAELDVAAGSVLTLGATRLVVEGLGGPGVANGGAGTGGIARLDSAGNAQLASLSVDANGFGGAASGPAGRGGDGQGGTFAANVTAGTTNVAGASSASVRGSAGDGAAGGDATGGAVTVSTAAGAQLNFADQLGVTVSAQTPGAVATANAGTINVQTAGTANFGGLALTSSSTGNGSGTGGAIIVGGTGTTTFGNAMITTAGSGANPSSGGIQLANIAGAAAGSNLTATTDGPLSAMNVTAAQNITLTANNGPLNANGVNAGGTLAATTTTGALTATTVRGGTNAALTTGSGTLTATNVTGGGAALTTGGGALNATGVNVTGAAALSSGTGATTATNIVAGTNATVTTTSGALNASNVSGPAIALATGSGALTAAGLNATQTIAATSTSGAVNVNGAAAGTSIGLSTANVVTLGGAIASPRVNVDSADIAIQADANVGGAGAQVALTARPGANQVTFGGTGQGPGYTLDAAEANRIQGASLSLLAPATGAAADRPADLLVRDVTLDGARLTALRLQSPGIVEVNGDLLLANAGANHAITIDGTSPAQRIIFVTPGSVRVRDAAGAPAGNVTLDARDIWIADEGLIAQLQEDRDFAGRDLALLTPGQDPAPRGFLEGHNVVLRPAESLYVQNSGTLTAFGGISVGHSLTIQGGLNGDPADVYAFGRRVSPSGDSAGTPFFFEVAFGGAFTNGSDFNTCIINPRLCPGSGAGLPGDDIEGGVEGDEGGPGTLPPLLPSDDLINEAALSEPLIEEPVTSGGDSSTWTDRQCTPGSSGDAAAVCDEQADPVVPPVPVPGQRP